MDLIRRALAEAIGTFTLVFAGCGAVVVNAQTDGALGHLGVVLAFALAITVMIFAVGHVSGGHFNPAVTLGFVVNRHLAIVDAVVYWVAQVAGAVLAAMMVKAAIGSEAHIGVTMPSGSNGQAFVVEMILTAFLVFVIMAVATDTRAFGQAAALAIGGTIALDGLFGGPITGASMNPARSFGPALIDGTFDALWIYLAAPAAGGIIGALLYAFIGGEHAASKRAHMSA